MTMNRWMAAAAAVCFGAVGAWTEDAPPSPSAVADVAAEEAITPEQAKDFVGKEVVVEGAITGVRFLEQSDRKPVFFNFGEPFPKHCFTVVIFGKDRAKFGDVPPEKRFDGQRVRVRGKVEEYRGKPQVVIEDPARIEILPAPPAPPAP